MLIIKRNLQMSLAMTHVTVMKVVMVYLILSCHKAVRSHLILTCMRFWCQSSFILVSGDIGCSVIAYIIVTDALETNYCPLLISLISSHCIHTLPIFLMPCFTCYHHPTVLICSNLSISFCLCQLCCRLYSADTVLLKSYTTESKE